MSVHTHEEYEYTLGNERPPTEERRAWGSWGCSQGGVLPWLFQLYGYCFIKIGTIYQVHIILSLKFFVMCLRSLNSY